MSYYCQRSPANFKKAVGFTTSLNGRYARADCRDLWKNTYTTFYKISCSNDIIINSFLLTMYKD